MYAIHTTPGLVLDSRPYGEAGKLLSIFTRDFGLVTATAQGIRLEKSKLRYFCQDYSFGEFSLVRGREFWRLTSATGTSPTADREASALSFGNVLIARLAQLLRRLLHGEEANPELFDAVQATALFLAARSAGPDDGGAPAHGALAGNAPASPSLSDDRLKSLESVAVLRILSLLGYVGDDASVAPFLGDAPLSDELLDAAAKSRAVLNAHANKALRESHL